MSKYAFEFGKQSNHEFTEFFTNFFDFVQGFKN